MRTIARIPVSVEALESELAQLSAHLEAATHRQLSLLRALEATGIWALHGARSFAGGVIVPSVPASEPSASFDTLRLITVARLVSAGTSIDDETLIPRWNGRAPDISACVAAGLPVLGERARSALGLRA